MIRDVTLGQYFPAKSIFHRLDARMKIVILTVIMIIIFCTFSYTALIATAFGIIAMVLMSGVPFKLYLKSLKTIIFIVIFTSLLNLFYGTGEPIWQYGILSITANGIRNSIFIVIRIISLILVSSILTFTTSPTDLTDAIESLLKPLTIFHIKVHETAMMMTIALRFIPTLLEETDKIMQAQKARGADMESGGVISRIKALVPILIPLFVSAFRRAYELATAMECRCYHGGNGRTRMKVLKLQTLDFVSLSIVIVFIVVVILCNIFCP